MDWNRFNTFNESKEKAFEIFSNQIFKFYCEKNYKQDMNNFVVINGAGGDGGIEAYAELSNNKIIAIQSKCFFYRIDSSEITQIRNSIKTAIKVRDNIQKYIVSIPRDLANKKKGVVNYERKKINDLFNEFKDTNIEFELWGEFELFDYIVKNNELTGVHKFWFDNSEIDFSTINRHFQLQKNGWLKDKYNKNLHVKTNINRQIELILGDEENKKEKIEKANGMIEIFKEYLLMFEKFMQIKNYDIRNKLEKIYNQQTKEIEEMIQHLLNIIKYLKNENIYLIDKTRSFNIDTAWFYNIEKDIMSMHYNKMKEYIEIIEDIDINQFLKQCEDEYFKRNILVIGDFGTGKTHSIVNQIEKELERKNVAILIRASDINSKSSWKEILSKALGLSNTWSEEEIFCALDLLANRNQYISDSSDSDIQINKKVLICFDGIDEYSDYGYWYEKQLEAEELIKTYRNFRFCFIGRRYAFKTIENLHSYKIVNFDYHPGFDMKEMFNKYMLHYNIKFTNSINIKTYLNNPIVLKNFSEINKNKTIDSLEGLKINLVDLFTIKLNKMNEEFLNNNVDINCKDVLNRSANIIANFLYSNNKICKKQIINLMNEDDFYGQDKIDSEIRSKYYHATHGSKSSVMSFVEKYIWCFRNEIMGYLADKLSMEKNNNLKFYNYIEIDDVLDPISEYEQNSNGKDKLQNAFIQENVFENIENLNYEEIGNWIKSEDLDINIEKWIYIKDKYWVLNRYDCFTNLRNNLEFTMWISSGIINKKDIKYLQDNLDNKQIYLYRIINDPESFSEYTNSDGSITPFEIINFDWNSVNESDFSNISLLDNTINRYKIHKTYESAFNVHTEFNEIHYKIPSKRIRNMLNINNNDGFEYKSDEEVVAVFEKNNKSWDDHHNILVADSKKIKEKINQNNETLVWFIRIDKDLNSLGREQYNKDIGRNSILIVCWFEKEKLNIKYIKE